ncbi:MAG: hypothetical protein CHACPFDD_00625 [Phycisphaerae bacterium]|nr:hypothetical protein [Phycisphaerae bacterium]
MNAQDERCRDVAPLLARALSGGLDQLDGVAVDRLAAHLDGCERCAAAMSGCAADGVPTAVPPIAMPADATWERVWRRIAQASETATVTASGADIVRFRRFASTAGLALAAALMMLIAIVGRLDPGRDTAELRLAPGGAVQIDGIEVADGTSFVLTIGSDDAPVIWVIDERSEDKP